MAKKTTTCVYIYLKELGNIILNLNHYLKMDKEEVQMSGL